MSWLFFILGFLYLACCGYLHQKKKVVFFYSFSDVLASMVNPIIIAVISFLYRSDIISYNVFIIICVISSILSFTPLWIITYRANNYKILSTLFIMTAKVLLGLLFLLLVVLSLVTYLYYGTEREKYERKKAYLERSEEERRTAATIAVGIGYLIVEYCCTNEDFSIPKPR